MWPFPGVRPNQFGWPDRVAVKVPGVEPTMVTLPRISLFVSLPANVASFVCPSTFRATVNLTSPALVVEAFEISPAPSGPEIAPVMRSPSCCKFNVIVLSPWPRLTLTDHVPLKLLRDGPPPPAGLRSTGRPSIKTCATRPLRSNRSPRVTVRLAIFPTSIEPSWFSTPRICAGQIVKARTASVAWSPFSITRPAFINRSEMFVNEPD